MTEGSAILPSAFGRYTLLERLGVGGMAEVFRSKIVLSHGFEKMLVIKRILPHLAADKNFVSMFIDEAKLTAQLTHPKIVQILDFGDVTGQYFISLELVDGFDGLVLLRTCAQKGVRLPAPLAVFVIMDVLEALDYAHNATDMDERPMHIVHRDISPSNIFISKGGDVKLGDFGIAHTRKRESKTQSGTLKGKHGYMSPEQINGAALDGRSDLFSIGVVLAEMLMGRRLFVAPSDLDIMLMVREGRLDRLDKYGRDLEPSLDAIVRCALKTVPAERYQTAAAFRDALADYLLESGQRVSASDLRTFGNELFEGGTDLATRIQRDQRPAKTIASPTTSASGPHSGARRGQSGGWSSRTRSSGPIGGVTVVGNVATSGGSVAGTGVAALAAAPTALAAAPAAPPVVDDQWGGKFDFSAAEGTIWKPPPESVAAAAPAPRDKSPAPAAPASDTADTGRPVSDAGLLVSGVPQAVPDSAGDVGVISPMRIFAELAVARETGVLRFDLPGHTKEIYLIGGQPDAVTSSVPGERFGEYLVAKGALRFSDLERVLAVLPQYAGRLGDALVGLGYMKALDVFHMLSRHVRERIIDVFTWTEGTFAFFRGVTSEQRGFPLGLDPFALLGAGVLGLPSMLLERSFSAQMDLRPCASGRTHIAPERFLVGPTPGELLRLLDGQQTLRALTAQLTVAAELLTFLRSLYLLVETDLVRFD
jgi:serine/threonine-protein kinase